MDEDDGTLCCSHGEPFDEGLDRPLTLEADRGVARGDDLKADLTGRPVSKTRFAAIDNHQASS
ncbi:hypothetical protein GCM10009826_31310 [Humibacillus xanthopallidus]